MGFFLFWLWGKWLPNKGSNPHHLHWKAKSQPLDCQWSPKMVNFMFYLNSVQSLGCVLPFSAPWAAAHQASLSFTISGDCSNSCPSSQWCHPTILSSVVPFFSCLQSFPASGSFPMSQFSLHYVAKVLEFQLQHQSFQWIFRTDLL